jgi:hypothetical protein
MCTPRVALFANVRSVGQEHKFGRWERDAASRNGVCFVRLLDASAAQQVNDAFKRHEQAEQSRDADVREEHESESEQLEPLDDQPRIAKHKKGAAAKGGKRQRTPSHNPKRRRKQ